MGFTKNWLPQIPTNYHFPSQKAMYWDKHVFFGPHLDENGCFTTLVQGYDVPSAGQDG